MRLRLPYVILPILALSGSGCLEITKNVTEGPEPEAFPRTVTVKIEYRQPNSCANVPEHCNDRVVFFGSWMAQTTPEPGVLLNKAPGTFVWTGRVGNVPVNFPPRDQPYFVRVFDPHMVQTDTGGVTALRLVFGGQTITYFDQPGTSAESGVIYVDDNGVGRNPY
jgi:hypothetical protein